MTTRAALLLSICLTAFVACAQVDSDSSPWQPTVIAAFPHDPTAFTQGLAIYQGKLFEGTGQYGASSIRSVDIESGEVDRFLPINRLYFGEGITIVGNRLYQLTWQNGVGFVYDVDTFAPIQTFRYAGEGWGLTFDGHNLILSDGTETLRFLDPEDFRVVRSVQVSDGERPVVRLNELEYINGEIWANVWYEDRIARISPATGLVVDWVDLSAIYPASQRPSDNVLNGIAFDAVNNRLFVTGKNWPQLFELAPPR
jgi:glutamine cyclotransferase